MGKVRSRRSKGKGRLQPTGLPSVKEAERQSALEGEGPAGAPLLDKLTSASAGDRESSCRSLSHLVLEDSVVRELMRHQLVTRLSPLLVDSEGIVREAAAGALRNLSMALGGDLCDSMVKQGVMAPLSVMLKECVMGLSSPAQLTGGERERGGGEMQEDGTRQQVIDIAEQGLNLLLNLSEQSPAVVEVFNREELLSVVLHFLQTDSYPPHLVTMAAQCLHTITEDNTATAQVIASSQAHLSFLEGILASSLSGPPTGLHLLLKTSVAGVFCNLLPSLPPPLHSRIWSSVLSVLGAVLDADISAHLHTLSSTPPHTPPQGAFSKPNPAVKKDALFEEVLNSLRAVRLALEVLANVCYVEEEEEEEGGWEDEEEEEEMVGDLMEEEREGEQSSAAPGQLASALTAVLEHGLHEKVWKKSHAVNPALYQLCTTIENGEKIIESYAAVHGRSLVALQNLVVALPVEVWGGATKLATIFSSLLALLETGSQFLAPSSVLGPLLVVGKRMSMEGGNLITPSQLGPLSQLGFTADHSAVRADVMALLGTVGKTALRGDSPPTDLLNMIGCVLRDCIAMDSSVWVVSQALDSVFDVFGDDNCSPSIFVSIELMPVLERTQSTFKARLRVEGRSLNAHSRAIVQNAKVNLPRFVRYMCTRSRTS